MDTLLFITFLLLLPVLPMLPRLLVSHLSHHHPHSRFVQMAARFSDGAGLNGMAHNHNIDSGLSLADIPKTNNFTSKLPPDPAFPSPADSHHAPRQKLGPRIVNGALYTYVRPEHQEEPELLAVSPKALEDLGLKRGEEETELFREVVAGNRILGWDEEKGEGLYPWAQRYGGGWSYPSPKVLVFPEAR